ncbi:A24 family peptidase [Vibrio ichthyoenteri]|uniref:prepilin peptidase n=1 Tax=Vibrio ichthyoenteri TaxID=142461 RepID=UPI000A01F506
MLYFIIALFLFSILVCFYDWRYRIIPNYICVFIFLISILTLIMSGNYLNLLYFALFVPVSLLIWKLGIWGAGDSKLLLAFFPMIASDYYLATLMYICLTGFATGIIFLTYRRISRNNKFDTVPYGIPIALSCFITSIASF